jgi:hypothetical protein
MEAVLEVYQTAYNPDIPVICIDEATKQLVRETQLPVAAQPGQPERIDYEYERNGTANLFMVCEPMVGWRRVEVTQQRTALDYAHLLKAIVDTDYPQADKLIVIQDNLNTHSPASLYKAFTPSEAQRILSRLEFCHTPKHGSWLNMAEIELSILGRQCLDRRMADMDTLKREVAAWQDERNHPKPMRLRLPNFRNAQDNGLKRERISRIGVGCATGAPVPTRSWGYGKKNWNRC